ncbi:GNAT family N-acetyltransferase [Actinomadura madurae]|uniref:GNAT family N-acetyltransferase n=1 Tax=Actinomadura madurae TaxID=1993 RepID=UPI0020D21DB3|nr:GNAT family N-acetyltransferase [Actinomadura madurae]MCP9967247.1 GNAT family N-acetyltransferase [Actinomadura madurae]
MRRGSSSWRAPVPRFIGPGSIRRFRRSSSRRISRGSTRSPPSGWWSACGTGETWPGFVNVNGIVRDSYQRGMLGYAAFLPYAGQGYLSEGVALAVRYAFERLELHRVEADIQPGNDASVRLVERLGFRREGFSPGFIKIDGEWRDHERWALTKGVDRVY